VDELSDMNMDILEGNTGLCGPILVIASIYKEFLLCAGFD
jgi:hypothetical protein